LANLPPVVNKRLEALKKQQVELLELEAEFHRGVYELDRQLQVKREALYANRQQIVTGVAEPTGSEGNVKGMVRALKEMELDKLVEGVPGFWLAILKYSPMLDTVVLEHDEPILEVSRRQPTLILTLKFSSQHLLDISVISTALPETTFTLHFQFSKNEFFKNATLTKKYFMKYKLDEESPLEFDGPEIVKSTGCPIDWNEGKNVTLKTLTTSDGETRTIMQESFFHFFHEPQIPDVEGMSNETLSELLETDFEIGHCLKEHIIPRAVLHFTGDTDDDSLSGCSGSEQEMDTSVDTVETPQDVDADGDH
jgi:nucleosome assembly protein 1-like 1